MHWLRKTVPQRLLKLFRAWDMYGTAEALPFVQSRGCRLARNAAGKDVEDPGSFESVDLAESMAGSYPPYEQNGFPVSIRYREGQTADSSAAPDFLLRLVTPQSSCGFPYRKPHTLVSPVPLAGNPGTLGMTKEAGALSFGCGGANNCLWMLFIPFATCRRQVSC